MKALKAAVARAKDGTLTDIAESIYDHWDRGMTMSEAVQAELVDKTIERYSKHITAALRRHGFELEEGEVLTQEVLARCISQKSGLEIDRLTTENIVAAADSYVSRRVSDLIGVEITSLQDVEAVKAQLVAGAVEAVKSGRANKFVSSRLIKKFRVERSFTDAGIASAVERKKLYARWYQKKFRRTHKSVWY